MPQVSVATGGTNIIAADPDQWRTVFIANLDVTNYVEVAIGGVPTAGQGLVLGKASAANVPANVGPIALPPGTTLDGRANTAACNVQYLVA